MSHRYASLAGRNVIVTGAGRGFGRLMSLALVNAGANVLGTTARNAAELEQTTQLAAGTAQGDAAERFSIAAGVAARAPGAAAGRFVALLSDASDYGQCTQAVARGIAEFGRIDALFNNAARGPREANDNYFAAKPKFWEAPPDAWARMVETNLIGAFNMAHAAMPHFLANNFGRIVNISTSLPTMVMQGLAAYGSTKAGLEVATIVWSRDLQGTGITANVLLPGGPADTALIPGGAVGTRTSGDYRQGKGTRGDEGRVGGLLPAEVMIAPTLWLAADDSNGCTGRRLVAKDWDPDLEPAAAAAGCMQEQHPIPRIR